MEIWSARLSLLTRIFTRINNLLPEFRGETVALLLLSTCQEDKEQRAGVPVVKSRTFLFSRHVQRWRRMWLSLNLTWTPAPSAPGRQSAVANGGVSSNKTSQACTCQSICLPPLSLSFVRLCSLFLFLFFQTYTHFFLSLLTGCLGLGVTWRNVSSFVWHSSHSFKDQSLFYQNGSGPGFFFPPRIVHLYYYIWHSRSWWVHGKSESWLLTLSTVFCSTLGLFGSILLPVSHFISNIDNPSEHSPHKDAIIKSNLNFFFLPKILSQSPAQGLISGRRTFCEILLSFNSFWNPECCQKTRMNLQKVKQNLLLEPERS